MQKFGLGVKDMVSRVTVNNIFLGLTASVLYIQWAKGYVL